MPHKSFRIGAVEECYPQARFTRCPLVLPRFLLALFNLHESSPLREGLYFPEHKTNGDIQQLLESVVYSSPFPPLLFSLLSERGWEQLPILGGPGSFSGSF